MAQKPSLSQLVDITVKLLLKLRTPDEVADSLHRVAAESVSAAKRIEQHVKSLRGVLGTKRLVARLGDLLQQFNSEESFAVGACYYDTDLCRLTTSSQCTGLGGAYGGDGSLCSWGPPKKRASSSRKGRSPKPRAIKH